MSDPRGFESPVTRTHPPATDARLVLRDESSTGKVLIKAAGDTEAARQLAVGFGSSRPDGDVLICGLRPEEWLLIGSRASVRTFVQGLDRAGHVSTIDHTHARAMFSLVGEEGPAVLEKVCSLDWSDLMTPDGAVASAAVAKVGCDLVRCDRDLRRYLVMCDRSFGQFLFDALLDAGKEFGVGAERGSFSPPMPGSR